MIRHFRRRFVVSAVSAVPIPTWSPPIEAAPALEDGLASATDGDVLFGPATIAFASGG